MHIKEALERVKAIVDAGNCNLLISKDDIDAIRVVFESRNIHAGEILEVPPPKETGRPKKLTIKRLVPGVDF